jgi:tetratricopeptide (TPR) repeat protein
MTPKIGRNEPCPCDSGKKYKKCCGADRPAADARVDSRPAAPLDLGPALALLRAGRHAELEAGVRDMLERYPDAGVLWKLLGAALHAQRKDHLPALEAAARLAPDDAESQTNLGNALRAHGRLEEAAERHRRAIELNAEYAEAHANLGTVLRDLARPEEAVASFSRAVAIRPDFALAHNNLGLVLQGLGRPEEAIGAHRRALAAKPDFPEGHASLGNAQRRLGRLEEAAACYRRAVVMKPDYAEALLNLGDTLFALRRFEPSAASYRSLLQLAPDFVEAHNNLGNVMRDMGQLASAVESFRAAIALKPAYAEAHNNLGNALLDLGQIETAVESYRRATELKPDYYKAYSNLGSALRELGKLEEAAQCFEQALAIEPDCLEALTNSALLQRLQGRSRLAEASLLRALQHNPASAPVIIGLAELSADKGRFTEAEDLYRRAFALDADSAAAWAGIADLRKMGAADADWIAQAERLALQPRRPREDAQLHFSIGKYRDDVGEYDRAFASFRRANETVKTYRPAHDRQQLSQTFEFVKELYDRDWIEQARVRAEVDPRPLFVVGMPRSGTSLAEQILASHPAVFGGGELSFWKSASLEVGAATLREGPSVDLSARFAREYLQMLGELAPECARVVDKMPANFAHLGMIHAALPAARIIHMRRNPIDTCLSIYFQNFHIAHSYSNDLGDLAHYYEEYLGVMEHWRAILPADAVLDVPYEALVQDPETWSRKMVEFADLPWDEACLNFHQTRRSVSTFSKWQVRQKINTTSVERWRNYAAFVGPLLRLQAAAEGGRLYGLARTEKADGEPPLSCRIHISS